MSDRRWYLPETYPENPARPPCLHDLGSLLRIGGIVMQGQGASVILLTPNGDEFDPAQIKVHRPSLAEWSEIIKITDDPSIYVGEAGQIEKVLHRKNRFAISGATQQRIWHRDSWTCLYCSKRVPEISLTIDHFISLENHGRNDSSNYISSCFRCNKSKGSSDTKIWLAKRKLDYNWFVDYLKNAPKIS